MRIEVGEFGRNSNGSRRTFLISVLPENEADTAVTIRLGGEVEVASDDVPRGRTEPAPEYVVLVLARRRTRGKRLVGEVCASHFLERRAGEWLLQRTEYLLDGAPGTPSDRQRRQTGLDRHRGHVEAALRYVESYQSRHADRLTRAQRSRPQPDEHATSLADIAFTGWGIDVPHTTRGQRPSVAPEQGGKAAENRRSRIRKRSVRE